MDPKKGLVPLAFLVPLTKVGAVAARTSGGGGGVGGRESAGIYVLAVGAPVAVTLLVLGYVYVSTAEQPKERNEGAPTKPRIFDYTEVGNQLVVTYEGEGSWDPKDLVVRYGGGQCDEEGEVERFKTEGDVRNGDGVSVNTDAVNGKVEVVWNGEVAGEYLPNG